MMHSFKDSRGRLWVACSECERGKNGNSKDKCACGWRVGRFNGLGCFMGGLMNRYIIKEEGNKIETISI